MDSHRDFTAGTLELPARLGLQSLPGYVRQHLELFESLIAFGVKSATLLAALRCAGFGDCGSRVLESVLYRARHYPMRGKRSLAMPGPGPIPTPRLPPVSPAPSARLAPHPTAEELRKTSAFDYQGTATLDKGRLLGRVNP